MQGLLSVHKQPEQRRGEMKKITFKKFCSIALKNPSEMKDYIVTGTPKVKDAEELKDIFLKKGIHDIIIKHCEFRSIGYKAEL